MLRLIFCGDRHWKDKQFIAEVMFYIFFELKEFILIEGEAEGADKMSREIGEEVLAIEVLRFPANWTKHGRAAGPIRNTQMRVEGKADGVIAFHDNLSASKGTKNMVDQAIKAALPTWVCTEGFEALEAFTKKFKR